MEISVVVIGRNEGFKLRQCFESIIKCQKSLVTEYTFQTIYVDSDSSDNSLEISKQLTIDHVIQIKGEINPAIARNVGASFAKFEWLLFIDGDMEVLPAFFVEEITKFFLQQEYFFSGQFTNVFYTPSWENLKAETFVPNKQVEVQLVPGGLFFVRKSIWDQLGGMKPYYVKSQDFEFGLRCFKAGYEFKRINKQLVLHHTISYLDQNRNLEFFKKGFYMYGRSMLYREHIFHSFNINCLKLAIKQDSSLILLFFSVLSIPILKYFAPLIYFIPLLIRVFKNSKSGPLFYFSYLLKRDISVAIGLFTFHPRKTNKYQVEIIKG